MSARVLRVGALLSTSTASAPSITTLHFSNFNIVLPHSPSFLDLYFPEQHCTVQLPSGCAVAEAGGYWPTGPTRRRTDRRLAGHSCRALTEADVTTDRVDQDNNQTDQHFTPTAQHRMVDIDAPRDLRVAPLWR